MIVFIVLNDLIGVVVVVVLAWFVVGGSFVCVFFSFIFAFIWYN